MRLILFCCFVNLMLGGTPADARGDTVSFTNEVEPIFRERCYSCHGSQKAEAGLRLDIRERALDGGDGGAVIRPNAPEKSRLMTLVEGSLPDERMPPSGEPLRPDQIEILRRWIKTGAPWPLNQSPINEDHPPHWSWQPIRQPSLPTILQDRWPRNAIDVFILQKLETEATVPSVDAPRTKLVRRAYLDILGLPPTPYETSVWLQSSKPDWYEQLIDQLLASPHYGERWARYWLDQARYADTDGYEKDQPRPHIWHWRDWVIRALNRDLPFDEFTEQQLAGDLLPGAPAEVHIATGFHRNTLTNREGGIDKEEDRIKQIVDRANTTFSVWMGLTLGCAQCHSHKYDPISQREYYRLFAFFNSTDEKDFPLPPTWLEQQNYDQALLQHQQSLAAKQHRLTAMRQMIADGLPQIVAQMLSEHPLGANLEISSGRVAKLSFDNVEENNRYTAIGEPTFHDGQVGQALQLDGNGQHVELNRTRDLETPGEFTCSAWIQASEGIGAIITKLNEANDFHGIDFTNNNGLLELHLVDHWPHNAIKVTSKARLGLHEWHHVAATYDGSKKAAGIRIYIDGKRQELETHHDSLQGTYASNEPWRIGRRRDGTFFHGLLDEITIYKRTLADHEIAVLAGHTKPLLDALAIARTPAAQRTNDQVETLIRYIGSTRKETAALQAALNQQKTNPPQAQHGMAMGLVNAETSRETYVHIRGEFLNKGPQVEVGVPAFLPPLKARAGVPDRLDLARWILAPTNPLTSRVTVNRIWQHLFGRGIVFSDSDFGTQGDNPTHPELLDWLASGFVGHDWSQKHLLRSLLSSATYRQSSKPRQDLADRDPYNTWLAFKNRRRVEAETVRDLALAVSGLMDRRITGPSVFPPLPPGIIELAFVDVINRGPWNVSRGGNRYRRGLYTFFQRTSPYPMLKLFDAPDSNTTCTRREESNTPLQALTLWNDNVFMESAASLAQRTIAETDGVQAIENRQDTKKIEHLFMLCVTRTPTKEEIQDATRLLGRSQKIYTQNEALARLVIGETVIPKTMTVAEFAAWVSLSRTMLNLDEFITQE